MEGGLLKERKQMGTGQVGEGVKKEMGIWVRWERGVSGGRAAGCCQGLRERDSVHRG